MKIIRIKIKNFFQWKKLIPDGKITSLPDTVWIGNTKISAWMLTLATGKVGFLLPDNISKNQAHKLFSGGVK